MSLSIEPTRLEGVLLIETDDLKEGNYKLEDDSNTEVATFTLSPQSFSVTRYSR